MSSLVSHIERKYGSSGDDLTGDEVAEILASQPANRASGYTAEELKKKWVASKMFVLMPIRFTFVGASKPHPADRSESTDPIIVDLNVNQFGRNVYSEFGGHGGVPEVLIIDGAHRWYQAQDEGRITLQAYVGDRALPHIEHCWKVLEKEIGEFLRNYFFTDSPGMAFSALKRLFDDDEEFQSLRRARKIFKETGIMPDYILIRYPFLQVK